VPTAIVTGVTGQDGSYLAELLLSKGYRVIGMVRRSSVITFERIQHIQDQIDIIQGDLHDQSSLMDLIEQYNPDEVYNLPPNPSSLPPGTNLCSPVKSPLWASPAC
jgi:GDPmannose 4,6-dehydratase